MDNAQMPNVSGVPGAAGAAGGSGVPGISGVPGMQPVRPLQPIMQQVVQAPPRKDNSGLAKTLAIIVMTLVAVMFAGLFVWIFMQYNEVKNDLDTKVEAAVAVAKDEQAKELEAKFAEREKNPYNTFSGPDDYGHLSFEYPKTWSVYIEKAATAGGDFAAYLNPVEVNAVGKETINALRVEIRDKGFDEVASEYQKAMDKKDSGLSMISTTIGAAGNITANRYTGTIPNTQLNGYIVIFKIRDKTAVLRADSVLFEADYDRVLSTVRFNE